MIPCSHANNHFTVSWERGSLVLSLGLTGWWECLCNSPSLHGPDSGGGGRPHCTGNLTTGGGREECSGGGGGHEPRCMSVRTTGSPPGKEVSSSFFYPSLPPPSLSPFLPPSLPPSLLPSSPMCCFFPPFFDFFSFFSRLADV